MARLNHSGGNTFHKAGCPCRACIARNRKAQTIPPGTGEPPNQLQAPQALKATPPKPQSANVIDADLSQGIIKGQDRTMRGRIAEWVAIRAADPKLTNKEIAEKLGIAAVTLNSYIQRAVRDGWLRFDDPISRIEHEIIPKTLDNLSALLDEKDPKITIETAKGVVFPSYKESKGIAHSQQNILVLNIETVAPPPLEVRTIKGTIVGKAKELPPIDALDAVMA